MGISDLLRENENKGINTFVKRLRQHALEYGLQEQFATDDKREFAARARAIYIWHNRAAHQAARLKQLNEAAFSHWVYRSWECTVHPALDGLVVLSDHPFWLSHYPANGWCCKCFVAGSRSVAGSKRLGGNLEKSLPDGWQYADLRTGIEPNFSGQTHPDLSAWLSVIENGTHHLV